MFATYLDLVIEWLTMLYTYYEALNFGMNADSFQTITDLYFQQGGAESCTPDLDRVHQGRWLVTTALNTLGQVMGLGYDLFDPCPYIAPE